jgi:phytanoyl-CoA hydroxylase
MFGRVVHEGLFFQHDSPTGRYVDLRFGEGWVGPSDGYRKIEKLERDPRLPRLAGEPGLRAGRARGGGRRGGHLSLDALRKERAWRHRPPLAPGRRELLGSRSRPPSYRSGPRSTTPLWTPAASRSSTPVTAPGWPRSWGAPSRPDAVARADCRPAQARLSPPRPARSSSSTTTCGTAPATTRPVAPRRAFTVSYMPASTRCMRKRRAPREFVRVFTRRASSSA